jgi:hypothetical protein
MSAIRRTAVVASAAALLAAVACGGGGNGTAGKSPQQIVKDARQAATHAKTVHVAGTINQSGQKLALNLREKTGAGAKGSITLGGSKIQLIRTSKAAFIKAGSKFYAQQGLPGQAAKLIAGKWFKVPGGAGGFSDVKSLTNLKTLFSQVLTVKGKKLKKTGTSTRHGVDVVGVKDTSGNGTLYVQTSGKPYPAEVAKGKQGSIRFTDWNAKVTVHAPKNAVDISQLQGSSG